MTRGPTRPVRVRAAGVLLALLIAALVLTGCANDKTDLIGMSEINLPDSAKAEMPAYGKGVRGELRKLRPQSGELLVVYFGYTFCPDVCPMTLSGVGAAVRTLPKADQEKIEAAMVTVDPARDKGPALAKYIAHFFPDSAAWAFRSSDKKLLKKTERAFGAASEIDPHKAGEAYTVTHTASLYVVDRNGQIVLLWPYGTLTEDIAADLKVLLARAADGTTSTQ